MNENDRRNQNDDRTLKEKWEELQGFHRATPIILLALAAFIVVCYCTAENGFLGKAISVVFMGLFSLGAWAIPAMLVIHAIFYADDLERGRIPSRIIFSVVTTIIISMVEYAITFSKNAPDGNPVIYFTEQRAGGFIGSALAYLMVEFFAWWGVLIIAITVLAIYIAYFYAGSNSAFGKAFFTVLEYIARFLAIIERWCIDIVGRIKDAIAEKRKQQIVEKHSELIDDDYFNVDNGMSVFKIKELGINEVKNPEQIENSPTLHDKVYIKSAVKDEPVQKSDEPHTEVKVQTQNLKRDRVTSFSYSFDHLKKDTHDVKKEQPAPEPAAGEKKRSDRISYGLDECAENVFTQDFDPFDFNAAEKIATRVSSKTPIKEKILPIYGEAVDIDNLTEEDVKRIHEKEALAKKMAAERAVREQRLREFEARKAMIISQANANGQAAANTPPASAPTAKSGGYKPSFTDYTSHTAKEDIFAVKETKIMERQAAEIKNRELAAEAAAANAIEVTPPERSEEAYTLMAEATYSNDTLKSETPAYEADTYPLQNTDEVSEDTYSPAATDNDSYEQEDYSAHVMPEAQTQAKTVEFKVYNEVSHNPAEDNSVQLTTHKYSDTASATAAIAEAVAAKNPMYARSENVINGSFSYTVKIDPEDIMEEEESEETEYHETEDICIIEDYDEIDDEPEATSTETLDVEREMVEPNPQTYARETSPTATYESEGYESDDNTDISATFSVVDSTPESEDNDSEGYDEFTWTPNQEEPIHLMDEDEDMEDAIGGFENTDDISDETDDEEIPEEEQNPDVIRQRGEFSFLRQEDEAYRRTVTAANIAPESSTPVTAAPAAPVNTAPVAPTPAAAPVNTAPVAPTPAAAPVNTAPVAPAPAPAPVNTVPGVEQVERAPANTTPIPKENKPLPPAPIEEKKEKPKPDYSNYQFPSTDLLISPPVENRNYTEEIQEKANKLLEALGSFSVNASIKGVDRGPRITRYEVVPARGVKVSSILNLQHDIALQLAAEAIRMEAPIPGKSAIGVEIPNKDATIVYLKELVESAEFQNSKAKTTICLGKDVAGTPVFDKVETMPHLLVAGATGMGKSVCINSFMMSILYKARPDEVKLIMIDPKQVEFNKYDGIPHLLVPVVSENKQAAGALMWAVGEMERRYALIKAQYVSDIYGYNEKVEKDPSIGEILPRIIIVIDEFADLMLSVKDPVEKLVQSLAQKARAAGIHLIIGTQRPAVNIITGNIKANIPARISCRMKFP